MLESFPVVVLIAAILGFFSGIGVGGGSLLILWLTLVANMEYTVARQINLLFFLPAAFLSCLFRVSQKHICWKIVIPAIIGGCFACILLSRISAGWDLEGIQKAFGVLLILVGIKEVFFHEKKAS